MSHRDVVLTWMTGQAEPGWDEDDPKFQSATQALDTLLGEHAHELAEKQRAEWSKIRSLITQIHPDDIAGIIDLIDPEAEE